LFENQIIEMSDFAFFSALNFCKDHAFFRYKKTNEKTLIKKAMYRIFLQSAG